MKFLSVLFLCFMLSSPLFAAVPAPWFEQFKKSASQEELYQFLYLMPKGGDLHNHLSGANFSEWWYELAVDEKTNGGYRYYTKTQLSLCNGYGTNQFVFTPSHLLFVTIQQSTFDSLTHCKQDQYTALVDLSEEQKAAWLNSIRLDKAHEGRSEFFETHWNRLNELVSNPHIIAEMLVKNMQAFAQENMIYLEMQVNARGKLKPDGNYYDPEQVVSLYKKRLAQKDARATNIIVRLQYALLRFAPDAEQQLEWMYQFVDKHRDLYVAINMVGREDNDKGYPLRFLSTMRKMRHKYPAIGLSIHAGEVDEPNSHVRDTLLLGADRIGHGLNLISDSNTMLLMRHNRYLVEINLISNKLLEYVENYSTHPFPEYLRTGIPVALSTDDRGMWDSTMTDEYYVAVKEFNLSWQELVTLGRNSLLYSFLPEKDKSDALNRLDKKMDAFEKQFKRSKKALLKSKKAPVKRAFICKHYKLCETL